MANAPLTQEAHCVVGSSSWRAKQQRVSSSVTLLTQSNSSTASSMLSEVITGSKLHPHMGLLVGSQDVDNVVLTRERAEILDCSDITQSERQEEEE